MAKQMTSEDLRTYPVKDNPLETVEVNRRNLLKFVGAAVGGSALFGAGMLARGSGGGESKEALGLAVSEGSYNTEDNAILDEKNIANPEQAAHSQEEPFKLDTFIDSEIYEDFRSPDYFHELAKESRRKLTEAHSITVEQVASPSDLPKVFSERFTEALNTGKTYEEIMMHIGEPSFTGDEQSWHIAKQNYLATAADTHNAAIREGLFGVDASTTTSRQVDAMLDRSRGLWFDHVRATGNINNVIRMNVLSSEVNVRNSGRHRAFMEVQFTDSVGSFATTPGQISISSTPDGEVFTTTINDQPENTVPLEEFKELAYR